MATSTIQNMNATKSSSTGYVFMRMKNLRILSLVNFIVGTHIAPTIPSADLPSSDVSAVGVKYTQTANYTEPARMILDTSGTITVQLINNLNTSTGFHTPVLGDVIECVFIWTV